MSLETFDVILTKTARGHLQSLDGSVRKRIAHKVDHLKTAPHVGKPLIGPLMGSHRIRAVERYRIVYRIDEEARRVVVWAIGIRHDGDAHDIYKVATAIAAAGGDVA